MSAGDIARYRPGSAVTEPFFVSSSKAFSGNVLFVIHSRHGKDVQPYSQHPSEKEVLFTADTRFRVLGVERRGDDTHIEMEETD